MNTARFSRINKLMSDVDKCYLQFMFNFYKEQIEQCVFYRSFFEKLFR